MLASESGLRAAASLFVDREAYGKSLLEAKENNEMSPQEAIGRSILGNIIASANGTAPQSFSFELRALVDKDELIKAHDFKSLLEHFRKDYELFSWKMISTLPSYPNGEMDIMAKTVGIETDNSYKYDIYFQVKQQLAILKIQAVSQIISEWNLRIEDLVEWFFSEYCKNTYGIQWLKLDFPHSDESTANRTATLLRIEESIRKQYLVFSEENEILRELVNETPTPAISQLPSFLSQKYAYLEKNQVAENILFMLFSDQSDIHWIDEQIKGEDFVDLIVKHDLKISDFLEYQRPNIKYLLDNKIIDEENKILRFRDKIKVEILREIYLFGSASYIYASVDEKVALKEMKSDQLITVGGSLFTKQESDYLNFILNNSVFDNSWAIRNKYQHGAPIYDGPKQYNIENSIALLILIIYIVKIDDELRLREQISY